METPKRLHPASERRRRGCLGTLIRSNSLHVKTYLAVNLTRRAFLLQRARERPPEPLGSTCSSAACASFSPVCRASGEATRCPPRPPTTLFLYRVSVRTRSTRTACVCAERRDLRARAKSIPPRRHTTHLMRCMLLIFFPQRKQTRLAADKPQQRLIS